MSESNPLAGLKAELSPGGRVAARKAPYFPRTVNHYPGLVAALLLVVMLFSPAARADSIDCAYFYADPDTYYASPGIFNADGSWTNAFTVTTTYVNNCAVPWTVGGGFGTNWDPMLADAPWFPGIKMTDFYDPFYEVAPGESVTLPFAWYLWDPNAPNGYTWVANINADGWGSSQFTAVVVHPVPEPGTLALLGTGLAGLFVRMRKKRK